MQGLWSLTSKVPDLLRQYLSPITKLFECTTTQPIDIEPPISPPILLLMTSQPTPALRLVQTDKPYPLATALPNIMMLYTENFELTSFDPEPPRQSQI